MLSIRPATEQDAALLETLIRELAEYERLLDSVVMTEADLRRDGFGTRPRFRAFIAEWEGQPAGYSLFFEVYSTFEGNAGLFLEDLFVRPQFRGKGIGKALLAHLARIARDEGYPRVNWEVLDWNQPAIDFYTALGGKFLDQWRSVRLTDEALRRLAEQAK